MSSEWISVKEQLPEVETVVLTFEKAKPIYAAHDYENQIQLAERFSGGAWCQRSDPQAYEITHWQPLPSPPKEQP